MRRIVMFNRVTLDGYFAGPDGNLNWVVPDVDLDRSVAAAIKRDPTDAILLGRRTYELFEAFWPHALDDASVSPNPHDPGQLSPEMRAMAVTLNETTKLVFSRTLKTLTWKNSQLMPTLDPGEIGAMKHQPGRNMIILGSGSIVSQLTAHGLIDEYQLLVSPVVLGAGKPLFNGPYEISRLTLREAKSYPSGNVMLWYVRGGT